MGQLRKEEKREGEKSKQNFIYFTILPRSSPVSEI